MSNASGADMSAFMSLETRSYHTFDGGSAGMGGFDPEEDGEFGSNPQLMRLMRDQVNEQLLKIVLSDFEEVSKTTIIIFILYYVLCTHLLLYLRLFYIYNHDFHIYMHQILYIYISINNQDFYITIEEYFII